MNENKNIPSSPSPENQNFEKQNLETSSEENSPNQKSPDSFFVEIIKFSLITLIIVIPFRIFIAKPFVVDGASMHPTFETGHYLITEQLSYHWEEPKRGEVVIFKYPRDPKRFFIKRIIGLPEETIKINKGEITVVNKKYPEGFSLDEEYVENKSEDSMEATLKKDEYFVLGDNRTNSSDSRSWGPLNKKLIVGRVFLRLLPITQIGSFPGNKDF